MLILVLILIGRQDACAQGFVNLDFEDANLSGYSAGPVPAVDAIPGWTAYLGGMALTNINYNVTGGITIEGSHRGSSIQGNYFIYLEGSGGFLQPDENASIGQTGTIPATARSMIFWGAFYTPFDIISFNGQPLPVTGTGSGANYSIYGVNISAFAGQTGQLLFTSRSTPAAGGDAIDNIQFSSSAVPEPGVLSLLGLGGLFLASRCRNRGACPRD